MDEASMYAKDAYNWVLHQESYFTFSRLLLRISQPESGWKQCLSLRRIEIASATRNLRHTVVWEDGLYLGACQEALSCLRTIRLLDHRWHDQSVCVLPTELSAIVSPLIVNI